MTKYHAKKTPCANGHTHASKREAARCNDLHLLQRAGEISGLQTEPRFTFAVEGRQVMMRNGQAARYTADFSYVEKGRKVVEDVKSSATDTEAFAVRWAFARAMWPQIDWRLT